MGMHSQWDGNVAGRCTQSVDDALPLMFGAKEKSLSSSVYFALLPYRWRVPMICA